MMLKMLPDKVDPAFKTWPFSSHLTQAEGLVAKIEELDSFLNENANKWLLGGRLAIEMKSLRLQVERGRRASTFMLSRAEKLSGREALIAAGIAFRLAKDRKSMRLGKKPVQDWLIINLKKLRSELGSLNSEYTMAGFARQIEIRKLILEKGLPGDSLVRRMWVMRSAARNN